MLVICSTDNYVLAKGETLKVPVHSPHLLRGLSSTDFRITENVWTLSSPKQVSKCLRNLLAINIGSEWEDKTRIYGLLYG